MKKRSGIQRCKMCLFLVIILIFVLGGCASIPKESVELSKEIGKGIAESQRSYTNLLNSYFTAKKLQVDQWIENEYLPGYLFNIQNGLKNAGLSTTLSDAKLRDVLRDVIAERDQKHTDLEKTRLLLLTKSNEHYNLLSQGNAGVTGLLQSMVDVKEATSSAAQTVKNTSGGKVDLDEIEKMFNDYLKKAGTAAAKATSLYEAAKSQLEKKGE